MKHNPLKLWITSTACITISVEVIASIDGNDHTRSWTITAIHYLSPNEIAGLTIGLLIWPILCKFERCMRSNARTNKRNARKIRRARKVYSSRTSYDIHH